MSRRRIVFACHEASRSGASILLLGFLRWLRDNTDLDFSVVLLRGGALISDFEAVAPLTYVHGSPNSPSTVRALRRIGWESAIEDGEARSGTKVARAVRLGARAATLRSLRHQIYNPREPDLVYLNTVASGSLLSVIHDGMPVLTHAHELAFQLRLQRRYEPGSIARILAQTHRYVAASHAVAAALSDVYGVDPEQLAICPEFIETADRAVASDHIRLAREQLGIGPDALVVGAVGSIEWRKGPDLFIQVAKRVVKEFGERQDVAFVWVGGAQEEWWEEAVRHELESLGLAAQVQFVGAVADPKPFVAVMDLLAHTSRSDAFPLACLEAGALAKPVVGFHAGGLAELLPESDHLTVPYLDVDAMAARISELLRSPRERASIGQRLAARVQERHATEVLAPVLLGQIEQTMAT